SPNFEKSISGTLGRAAAPPPPAAAAAGVPDASACLTNDLTSSGVMRDFGPVPLTRLRSTPSSRANLRSDGLAYARAKPASSMGGRPAGALADAGAGAGAARFAGSAAGPAAFDAEVSVRSAR